MKLLSSLLCALAAGIALVSARAVAADEHQLEKRWFPIKPKVMIISMFSLENVWTEPLSLTENITLPGLSYLYPNVTCDAAGDICHITTGEAEINAACSVSALALSSDFDLRSTYFFIAGIAGVNPYVSTLGGVGFARYAFQFGIGYQLAPQQQPSNWSATDVGFWLFGTNSPDVMTTPENFYGTELYELNTNLRQAVLNYTTGVELNDTQGAQEYRALYNYAPANMTPSIVLAGTHSSPCVWFVGLYYGEAVGNLTSLWTNGTGTYGFTGQEDNASFEALIRADLAGKVDFSRVILMRTASDFDRAPPNVSEYDSLFQSQIGFEVAINNIPIVGTPIVQGIINDWNSTFEKGIEPQEGWLYNADDLNSLAPAVAMRKRETHEAMGRGRRGRMLA